jgi:protein required for attachment to host cells
LLLRKEPNSNIYEKTTIGELKKLYHPSIEDQLVEEIVRYVEHQIIFDEEVHDRFVKIDSQRTSQGIR